MSAEYRIETVGREFSVIDPWDEEVGRYASAEEAKQDIDRCKNRMRCTRPQTPCGYFRQDANADARR